MVLNIYLELVVNHCDLNLKTRFLRYQHIQLYATSLELYIKEKKKERKKGLCLMKAGTGLHCYVPEQC